MRTTAAIAALVLVSFAVPAATTGARKMPRCAGSGLVVWLDTSPGGGAAGSVYYQLKFNLASHACHLFGFPGVSAVGLGGRQLGSAAARNHTRVARLVTLAPGATAAAVLQVVHAENFPRASCRQVTAAGLRVYPPDQTASKLVPFPFRACARSGPIYLTVQALRHA